MFREVKGKKGKAGKARKAGKAWKAGREEGREKGSPTSIILQQI